MAKNGNIHPTRIFKEPKELEAVWIKYKEELKKDSTKWENIQYVGKDGDKKVDCPKLPLTFEGLKRYCWENKIGTIEHYFVNKENLYSNFGSICRAIKYEIREDQITGGILGFYNPSITQRLNNLKEHTENVNITDVKLLTIDPLDDSED